MKQLFIKGQKAELGENIRVFTSCRQCYERGETKTENNRLLTKSYNNDKLTFTIIDINDEI